MVKKINVVSFSNIKDNKEDVNENAERAQIQEAVELEEQHLKVVEQHPKGVLEPPTMVVPPKPKKNTK